MYRLYAYANIGVTTEEQTASSQQSGKNQGTATKLLTTKKQHEDQTPYFNLFPIPLVPVLRNFSRTSGQYFFWFTPQEIYL